MLKIKFLFFLLLGSPAIATAIENQKINVEAEFLPEKFELKFSIKNFSQDEIEIENGNLPWGYHTSVWMHLETFNKDCKPMLEYTTLENSALVKRFTQIPPTVATYGSVFLLNRWRDLKKRDVNCQDVIFWSYELIDRNRKSHGRFSGAVLVPITGQGK